MVPYEEYNALYEHYQDVVAVMAMTLLTFVILFITFLALYSKERRLRRALQGQIDLNHDPRHQLALIQTLSEAGRDEMRKTVTEAQQALSTFAAGARR